MPTQAEIDTNMKAMANKLGQGYNATTGQIVDTTKPVIDQLPTGNQAQIDANANIRNIATADKLGQTYNVDTQQYEAGPTALEIQRNKEQAAFNARNPVGTKATDISWTPDSQIADEQAFKPSTTPVTNAGGTNTSQTSTTGLKTQEKGAPQVDFNSSVGREEQIGNNLAIITTQTPELLTDRAKYDKAFGYSTADEGKKALLDGFFASGKKNIDNINTIKQYSGASVNDLSASLLDGSISPSVKNILISDPIMQAKLAKAEALNKISGKKVDTTAVGEKQTAEVLASKPTIANALENGEIGTDELNALTSSPEQIALKKKRDIEFEDLNKKTAIYDKIEDDIGASLIGKNVTESDRAQMVANARKALLPELNRAERAYNNTTAQLTELKKEALSLLETNLSLYKEQKAAEAKVVADKTNFEQQKEIARYQNQLSQANVTTEKIVDPATGKTVLVNSKTGDIVASYNTGLKKENLDFGKIGVNPETGEDIMGFVDKVNRKTYNMDGSQSSIGTPTATTTTQSNVLSSPILNTPDGTKLDNPNTSRDEGQCGAFVNDALGTPSLFGDTLDSKLKVAKDNTGTVGSAIVFSSPGKFAANGHVGIIVADNGDSWTVKSSNRMGDGKVSTDKISKNYSAIKGYYTPSSSGTTSFSPSEEAAFTNFKGDSKDLGKEIGTSAKVAQDKYNSWKAGRELNDDDKGILSAFLKDISGAAVSGDEYTRNETRYLGYKKQGLNQSEIKDKLAGYYPTDNNKNNQSVKNQLAELRSQALLAGSKVMEQVANQVNSGNFKGAVNTIEQAKYKQAGMKVDDMSTVGSYIQQGNKLMKRIEELKSKFGPIAGKLEEWGQYVQNDTQTQGLQSQMTAFAAEYRNRIGGTALTGNEEQFLSTLIPSITNNPDNAKEKVRTQLEVAFNKINNQRANIGLPRLTSIEQTYNEELRANAFKGKAQPTQVKTETPLERAARLRKEANK